MGMQFTARADRGDAMSGRRRHPRFHWSAVVVALVSLTGSVVGAVAWYGHVRSVGIEQFEQSATGSAAALSLALQRDAELSSTAGVMVETTPGFTNAQLATWFGRLARTTRYPGSFGLMYVQRVTESQLPAFEQRVAVDPPFGLPAVTPFTPTPPPSAGGACLTRAGDVQATPKRFPLSVKELSSLLALALPSINYCALPIGRFLSEAASTGVPAAANLATLVKTMPDPTGHGVTPALVRAVRHARLVMTMTPLYATSKPLAARARTSALTGWVIGVFEAKSIMAPVLNAHHGLEATLSYRSATTGAIVVDGRRPGPGMLARTIALSGPGRWSVTLAEPSSTMSRPALLQGLAVLAGGLVITLLLLLLVRLPDRARLQALDLVEQRTAELRHQALHDQLTDLPNRDLISDRLEQMLSRASRGLTEIAVLYVDLDQFKNVNDTLGHGAGDELLRQVAARLSANLRPGDTVGRIGGDEFVVLLEDAVNALQAEAIAQRLIVSLGEPFILDAEGHTLRLQTASIGIATGARDTAEQLLGDADLALYEAKARKIGRYVVYSPEMRAAVMSRLALDAQLKEAVQSRQLYLVYQPVFKLDDRRVVGAEALLRWHHPVHGEVLPGEFIPVLEANGMILEVGNRVLYEACSQAAKWRNAGHDIYVSVNVSALQFEAPDFVSVVRHALSSARLPAHALMLEITETSIMRDSDMAVDRLRQLREVGVKLAIDDFGTGYCSLAYLQAFPVHALKIDRSFIARLEESPYSQQLVHTIMQLAAALSLDTVAEGVETTFQLASLLAERCTAAQGFLFARPMSVEATADLLTLGPSLGDMAGRWPAVR